MFHVGWIQRAWPAIERGPPRPKFVPMEHLPSRVALSILKRNHGFDRNPSTPFGWIFSISSFNHHQAHDHREQGWYTREGRKLYLYGQIGISGTHPSRHRTHVRRPLVLQRWQPWSERNHRHTWKCAPNIDPCLGEFV